MSNKRNVATDLRKPKFRLNKRTFFEFLYRLLGQPDYPYVRPPKDRRHMYFSKDELIEFNNDGLDVWIGNVNEWTFHTTHEQFRKVALWYLYQYAIVDWFGLRSYLWYKLLNILK